MKRPAQQWPTSTNLFPLPRRSISRATSLQRAVHRALLDSHRSILLKIHTPFAESEITQDEKRRGNVVVAGWEWKKEPETLARHSLVSRDHKLGNLRAPPDPDTIPRHYFHGQRQFLVALSFPWHRYCCRGTDTTRTFYPDPFHPPRNNLWLFPRNSSRRRTIDRRKMLLKFVEKYLMERMLTFLIRSWREIKVWSIY